MAASRAQIIILLILAAEIVATEPRSLIQINPSNIIFALYKRNDNETLKNPRSAENDMDSINTTIPTILIIHGWMAKSNYTWVQNMTNLLLKKHYPCNVITVDWSAYSTSINYPVVRLQTRQVGDLVGNFIVNVTKNNTKNLANVHIIGHSLGAQAAGFAGQTIYAKLNEKIARITGLDAAGPLFELLPPSARLSKDDAHEVHAIHTNGGTFGFRERYGTSDFFANGGSHQPGCKSDACSHSLSHDLYIESIISDGFVATKCSSYYVYLLGLCSVNNKTVMGDNQPSKPFGRYYLFTNADPPYAKGNV